jgi:hypothetical protein
MMEADLIRKSTEALQCADLSLRVFGVFSLDDMENMLVNDLRNGIAVGVGYLGSQATPHSAPNQLNVDRGNAARGVEFSYMLLLAIPTQNGCCDVRYDALELLASLRNRILGSTIQGDVVNRTWDFVQEKPDISESSLSVLYYSQVWRTVLMATGKP